MKYEKADNAIREHKEKKMQISKDLYNLGFHAAIEKMYNSGIGPTAIARKYNEMAGYKIITAVTVSTSLYKTEVETYKKGEAKTKKDGVCSCCKKPFIKTLINIKLCPKCYHSAGHTTEYYAVNRAGGS